jgi:hypothetical protein
MVVAGFGRRRAGGPSGLTLFRMGRARSPIARSYTRAEMRDAIPA